MRIHVIPTVEAATADALRQRTVIVIDALRATSVMIAALAAGCREIVPVETADEARELREAGDLLAGERDCRMIPGFDLGNSPGEFHAAAVAGRRIVMTTTNGTRALLKAGGHARVLPGSFLNARACAVQAASCADDIVLLCAGTKDAFALEDALCAGAIVSELLELSVARGKAGGEPQPAWSLSDEAQAALYAYRGARSALTEALLGSASGRRLAALGLRADVVACAAVHSLDVRAVAEAGRIRRVAPPGPVLNEPSTHTLK